MENNPQIVKSHDIHLDTEYTQWIYEIKERYRSTQLKTAVKVNLEQLLFNWMLGKELATRRAQEKWGIGIVEQISLDLQNEFPNAKGFSTTNLWNMKKRFSFYANDLEKLQQAVGEIDFPKIFAFVPWGHHIQIITKCKSIEEAVFYMKKIVLDGAEIHSSIISILITIEK